MFRYPISRRDLFRTVMIRIPAAGVSFQDPVLQDFYTDHLNGLCTFEVVNTEVRTVLDKIKDLGKPGQYSVEQTHLVHISYIDPELEFERRLSV